MPASTIKKLNLEIPREKLVDLQVSQLGKSSLAFDTLYAEEQRRSVESYLLCPTVFGQRRSLKLITLTVYHQLLQSAKKQPARFLVPLCELLRNI